MLCRLRQQQGLAQLQQQQEAAGEAEEEEEESGEEDDSEYTTDDSEDEALGGRQLMKPVFVPKTDREASVWGSLGVHAWCWHSAY